MVACYLNALNLVKTGRPARSHFEMVRIGLDLAKDLGDEKFYRAIRRAEKLHVNFTIYFWILKIYGNYTTRLCTLS